MPLTQEKRLESNFSNNNDHSYLHKKFKKMASTISVFPGTNSKGDETRYKDENVEKTAYDSSISNGSIAAAHPEIEKIKDRQVVNRHNVDNVQINFNENRNSDVNNVQQSGQTSFTDEFSNKTENLENDFIRDAYNGTTAGRYICPYCKLSCAKPSVLQKHIRAHTNERPYPCVPCGFAFKTKSNLYKHRRSRTHALRLQGADVPAAVNDEDLSGGSESDTSIPPTSISDTGSEPSIIRLEVPRPNEFSSPELTNDSIISINNSSSNDNIKPKTIYKPKFRAALYQENDDKDKLRKSISQNADFLTEHISKIISDNEAIVDVIDTPLQKKYGKIKQIAESKQFLLDNAIEIKCEQSPLNLTKSCSESDNSFRKRSHSESLTQLDYHKHPLNPEGSIIKDLLLKTKGNGIVPVLNEDGPSFVCPLCQIPYRSIENLEVHRTYYCKGYVSNNIITLNHTPKDVKVLRPENIFVRSNSVNVRLPETPTTPFSKLSKSPPLKLKPDNLVIAKSETYEITAPLPSPGPLLGNTRLVDTRTPDLNRKTENLKINRPMVSPKRRLDSRSDTYSPRSIENVSPRSADLYVQPKIRCIDANSVTLRSLEENSHHLRHNSTSLQMFGGEVKIVDHMGSTTTLRIEPSKNQLSPILIQQTLSPSKIVNDAEASSIVVRSGLHSGGTMVHNPPTPKEVIGTPQPKTPRIALQMSAASGVCVMPSMHDITHFQFPPLSAITAYNPLTLPPLSPSSSPSGTSTILHGGKLIPHVPGMPGPNTSGILMGSSKSQGKNMTCSDSKTLLPQTDTATQNSRAIIKTVRSPARSLQIEPEKSIIYQEHKAETNQYTSVPIIKIKNVDEPNLVQNLFSANVTRTAVSRQDIGIKRTVGGSSKVSILKENVNFITQKVKTTEKTSILAQPAENKQDGEIRNYNFENMITKAEIYNNLIPNSSEIQKNTNAQETPPVSTQNERSETSYFQKNVIKSVAEERKPKFLRPSTLPLKPGTFTPKRHHGITPNANTMPLVSPETPRPAKAYGQLYLNGNAYTYLGLKCSTKVFYCTINRPQPTYVPNQHFLSMYSNWQLLSELTPDPLGLSASSAMSLYDSRHRPQNMSVAVIKQDLTLTHSSQCNKNNKDNKQMTPSLDAKSDDCKLQLSENVPKKELTGGFESNEEYTYVRGRGRGRYVCSECGIRCKKPSMLKKHIRTHTDVRPYTCIHCAFSFKTKGNLTKHMKSKAHYKKCCELGINPNEGNDDGGELAQSGETDDDTDSDADEGNEGETESSDTEACKSRLPEHEAAHCLLSLGGARPGAVATPGLLTSARPTTYPYTPPASTPDQGLSKDQDNEPMDLSKSDLKFTPNITEIPTARESSVLASLASNTAKLPQHHSQWTNGEPLLHTYLTERALLDTKIKQSQLTINQSKIRKLDVEKQLFDKKDAESDDDSVTATSTKSIVFITTSSPHHQKISTTSTITSESEITKKLTMQKDDFVTVSSETVNVNVEAKNIRSSSSNAENAKHVVSEYLKQARINLIKSQEDSAPMQTDGFKEEIYKGGEDKSNDECNLSDSDSVKLPGVDHDPVARKVVIGVGGVAFKVTKGKDFDSSSYPPGRLMEDGRRVCDFCNKTFTKPSQLRLHLNIHYMERPFRCSVCAVSFRTRGHLQKHERSGSHHNKVSMTSTFGAATSFNPRPFRCSDCNIAFRIHGHLAKHLRSKMHVMRLECLFKLPFGTFTEIERAGVSLTDIDTTDCASSLASLQSLARKLHEKDPSKLEYREAAPQDGERDRDSDDTTTTVPHCTLESATVGHEDADPGDCSDAIDKDTIHYSATDN